jgi:hypothetical protein
MSLSRERVVGIGLLRPCSLSQGIALLLASARRPTSAEKRAGSSYHSLDLAHALPSKQRRYRWIDPLPQSPALRTPGDCSATQLLQSKWIRNSVHAFAPTAGPAYCDGAIIEHHSDVRPNDIDAFNLVDVHLDDVAQPSFDSNAVVCDNNDRVFLAKPRNQEHNGHDADELQYR